MKSDLGMVVRKRSGKEYYLVELIFFGLVVSTAEGMFSLVDSLYLPKSYFT